MKFTTIILAAGVATVVVARLPETSLKSNGILTPDEYFEKPKWENTQASWTRKSNLGNGASLASPKDASCPFKSREMLNPSPKIWRVVSLPSGYASRPSAPKPTGYPAPPPSHPTSYGTVPVPSGYSASVPAPPSASYVAPPAPTGTSPYIPPVYSQPVPSTTVSPVYGAAAGLKYAHAFSPAIVIGAVIGCLLLF